MKICDSSSPDAMIAPQLWRQVRELVYFTDGSRGSAIGCSRFPSPPIGTDRAFSIVRRLCLSPEQQVVFSRCSTRVHLSSLVPCSGSANSSNRRSSQFVGDREDSVIHRNKSHMMNQRSRMNTRMADVLIRSTVEKRVTRQGTAIACCDTAGKSLRTYAELIPAKKKL